MLLIIFMSHKKYEKKKILYISMYIKKVALNVLPQHRQDIVRI